MSFPVTIDEMRRQGYKHNGDGTCRSCSADIEWWITPNGKHLPFDANTATPHWSTCPEADSFRKDTPAPTSKITSATLNMDWLKEQAKGCHCVVCKKLTGR
jgi:hypothetical protein